MTTDPLGLIGNSGPMRSVGPVGVPGQRTPAGGVPTDPDAPSFKDLLMENLEQVNKLQQDATHAIEDLQTGKRDDVENVVMATQKADTAFRMLMQVRNKLVDAYSQIEQIRV